MGLLLFHSGVSAKYGELKDPGTEGWTMCPSVPPLSTGHPVGDRDFHNWTETAPTRRDWFYLAFALAGLSV